MTEQGFLEYNIMSVHSRDSCQFVRAILIIVLMNRRFPLNNNNNNIYFTSKIISIIIIIIAKVPAGTSDRFSLVLRYNELA